MTQSDAATHDDAVTDDIRPLLAAFGIEVTEEGKARARKRLKDAEANWTPEKWAALDAQLGADRAA